MIRFHRASQAINGSSCEGCGRSVLDFPDGLRPAELLVDDLWVARFSIPERSEEKIIRICAECAIEFAADMQLNLQHRRKR